MANFQTEAHYMSESDRLLDEGKWHEQLSLMQDAVRRFPRNAEFEYRLAAANAIDSPIQAVDHATRAVSLAPRDPLVLGRCASLMYELGEHRLAEDYVRRTVRVADDDFPLLADMLHLIGKLALQKENDEVAERYLSLAFELEPDTRGHADFLATFLAKGGRLEEATAVVDQALAGAAPDRERLLEIRRAVDSARTQQDRRA